MTAIRQPTSTITDGLRSTDFTRDLRSIAELIELCFGDHLDRSGRAAVRDMKLVASMAPLLWILGALDTASMGLGYVWLIDRRVVGNLSLFRTNSKDSDLSGGWIIANVAVHPNQRRQGLARRLLETALDFIGRHPSGWALLQVEHDNTGAIDLYQHLDFDEIGRVTQWKYTGGRPANRLHNTVKPRPRLRKNSEWPAELQLARRDRSLGLSWARPLDSTSFQTNSITRILSFLGGKRRLRSVLDDGSQLTGSLWVDRATGASTRFTLLLDPSANQVETGLALVQHGLNSLRSSKHLTLETSERDPALAAELRQLGFQPTRTLIQMQWHTQPAQ